jgi:di/tricarboxylate transporter
MKTPLRISLRLLGALLFVASLAATVYIVAAGPDHVAEQMGKSCRHATNAQSEWCTWRDALGYLEALPFVTFVGAVLLLVMRPGRTPTLDLSRPGRGWLRVLAPLGVIALVLVTFAGSFVYRTTYSVAETVERYDEVRRGMAHPVFPDRPAPVRSAQP